MSRMRYLDTFAGIGGFTLAITQTYDNRPHIRHRATCIGFSEIDKYASQIYQKHFPNHKAYGSITEIDTATLPDFDLLTGGFPCQSFSIAGKRGGFEDTRGTLFFELARILRAKRPKNFIFENVKGLLSHDKGNTFKIIIGTLTELGYCVEWQVLNSKNFGVPQNRERVFIVGHLGGDPRRKVFPIGQDGERVDEGEQGGVEVQTAQCLNARMHKMGRDDNYITAPVLTPGRLEKRQKGRRFKESGEPSFPLTSQDKHGVYDGVRIRRLTPLECERLQGFPDFWTAEGTEGKISDTQRYKCCGNAITVNVAREIIKRLYE